MLRDKVLMAKVAQAQMLAKAGVKQTEIAKELGGVTTRTVRRWLSFDMPDEMVAPLSDLERESREAFISRAWPLVTDLIGLVEDQVAAGEIKGRDALTGLGILIDRIRALSPPIQVTQEAEEVHFVFTCDTKEEQEKKELEQLPELTDGTSDDGEEDTEED